MEESVSAHSNNDLFLLAIVVVGVLITIVASGLASRFRFSAPVALVVIGGAISYVPGFPPFRLDPNWILFAILPPLLYAAAIRTSIVDARARKDPIILLSVVLVAYTVVVIGGFTWLVIPGVSLAAALAFGAVVAPTDAVAVGSVTRKAPLPRRVTTVLEGESLLNDATAVAALNSAIAAIVATVTPVQVVGGFVLQAAGGVALGLVAGVVLGWVRKRLREPVLDTSLSFAAPFIAFVPAQAVGASGILAVVVAGLYLSVRSPAIQSPEARIAETLNWRTISFLLENIVFLLIGLSLSGIVTTALHSRVPAWLIAVLAILVLVALLLSRLIWGLMLTAVFRWGPRRLRAESWHWHRTVVISFAGARGVVTLAAALLLPAQTPQRGILQLLALVVVIGTLLQTLLLPALVRALPSLRPPDLAQERSETRRLLSEAQESGLAAIAGMKLDDRVQARLRSDSTFLAESMKEMREGGDRLHESYSKARRLTLKAEREAVLKARAEKRFHESAVRAVLRILDAEEVAFDQIERRAPSE